MLYICWALVRGDFSHRILNPVIHSVQRQMFYTFLTFSHSLTPMLPLGHAPQHFLQIFWLTMYCSYIQPRRPGRDSCMRNRAILHLLVSSELVTSKDTQDIFIDPYANLFCSPCIWEDRETNSLNCLLRSMWERCKTRRLKRDLYTLYIRVCDDLLAWNDLLSIFAMGVWGSLISMLWAKMNMEKEVKRESVDAKTLPYLTDAISVFTGPRHIWIAQQPDKTHE